MVTLQHYWPDPQKWWIYRHSRQQGWAVVPPFSLDRRPLFFASGAEALTAFAKAGSDA